MVEEMRLLFQLEAMERVSPEMLNWLRGKLCP
jgi:hypothetical protein